MKQFVSTFIIALVVSSLLNGVKISFVDPPQQIEQPQTAVTGEPQNQGVMPDGSQQQSSQQQGSDQHSSYQQGSQQQ